MAATSLATSPSATPDCLLIRPLTGRIPSLRAHSLHRRRARPIVLRSIPESRSAVTEAERQDGDLFRKKLDAYSQNGNGNGYASANGSVEVLLKGNGAANGSLVKYVGGNGAATAEVVGEVTEERKRKKRVEEIGREDAWFRTGGSTPQVSVTPGGRWNRFKTYSTIQRTVEIWGSVFTFIFKVWLNNQKFSYRGGMTEEKKVLRRKSLAKWLKESILRLGPTFIKIGQQFSTRVDILAQEYVDQLSELQDQVPPFPSETAVSIIEEELGAPLGDIFDRFDYEPIAAASLGQVHRASLKGQEVVVKVQRPGLKDLFDIDLKNLRVIAEYLQKVDPKSDGAKRDWVAIYDECASVLYEEIDYTKEAANAELFAKNFESMDYVKVPSIYWDYTTPQVLTMEYVPGIKINRIKQLDQLGVDRQRLSRYAVESYLEQILSHGFFHADPHPGNIAVDDFNGGRLIFYDFGMMGSISPNIREGLLETFYGVYEKDPDKVLQAMIQMGVLVPTGDMTAVRRSRVFAMSRRVLCKFFAHGACLKGEHCEFSHDWKDPSNNVCTFYQKGVCSFGSRCRYDHVKVPRYHGSAQPSSSNSDPNTTSDSVKVAPPFGVPLNGEVRPAWTADLSVSSTPFLPVGTPEWTQGYETLTDSENEIGYNPTYLDPADKPICSYAAAGNCLRGERCPHIHGDMCSICGKHCLHPYRPNEREEHMELCEKNHKRLEALRRSQEIECSVCLDRVLSKPVAERKFGLLSECDHAFCISCIRDWRNNSPSSGLDLNSALRACPICRKLSYFVIPSIIWYSTKEEKQEIIDNYKAKLKSIDCKYFDFGNGTCPFGTSCFYKHAYRDGRIEEVVLRHFDAEDGSTVIAKDIRLSDFFRDLRL